jgi:hypothetical protein
MSGTISAGCGDWSSTAIYEPLNFRLGGSAFTVGPGELPLFQQGNPAGILTRVAFSYHIAWQSSRKFLPRLGKQKLICRLQRNFIKNVFHLFL